MLRICSASAGPPALGCHGIAAGHGSLHSAPQTSHHSHACPPGCRTRGDMSGSPCPCSHDPGYGFPHCHPVNDRWLRNGQSCLHVPLVFHTPCPDRACEGCWGPSSAAGSVSLPSHPQCCHHDLPAWVMPPAGTLLRPGCQGRAPGHHLGPPPPPPTLPALPEPVRPTTKSEAGGKRAEEGEGKSARRAALPGKPTVAYSQPAAITSTKWRR